MIVTLSYQIHKQHEENNFNSTILNYKTINPLSYLMDKQHEGNNFSSTILNYKTIKTIDSLLHNFGFYIIYHEER
jgi:hypothetical protein